MPNENYFNPGVQFKQMGFGAYGEPVWGNVGMTSDDWLKQAQMGQMKFNQKLQGQKFDLVKGMLGKLFGGGMGSGFGSGMTGNPMGMMAPAPRYISASPVYSQGQVDAQSNLQRANLLQQGATQTQQFANQLGSRGFSPLSPLAGMVGNMNEMRARSGAAQNETNLNFQAAQANSDARLKAAGINAGMYGDWAKSLLGFQSMRYDNQFRSQQLQQQLLGQLLGQLG